MASQEKDIAGLSRPHKWHLQIKNAFFHFYFLFLWSFAIEVEIPAASHKLEHRPWKHWSLSSLNTREDVGNVRMKCSDYETSFALGPEAVSGGPGHSRGRSVKSFHVRRIAGPLATWLRS